ncbi:hypothetical protein, partial [Vibrio harveyi]|uniref:hypothetical protein n=1 Tax=Vibrio harveyi TaxID=669 RepID=UPI001E331B1B
SFEKWRLYPFNLCFLLSFVLHYIRQKLAVKTTYCFNPQLRVFTKNSMIVSQNAKKVISSVRVLIQAAYRHTELVQFLNKKRVNKIHPHSG